VAGLLEKKLNFVCMGKIPSNELSPS